MAIDDAIRDMRNDILRLRGLQSALSELKRPYGIGKARKGLVAAG